MDATLRRRVESRRNPVLPTGLTPRLRAKELSQAVQDSDWPSKNLYTPKPPPPPKFERRQEEPPVSTRHRKCAAKILADLEEMADDEEVQKLLYDSCAAHCGSFLPREAQMLIYRAKMKATTRGLNSTRMPPVNSEAETGSPRKASRAGSLVVSARRDGFFEQLSTVSDRCSPSKYRGE